MINILCFGDSNTFGSNPAGGRHPRDVRWPGRLQELLGPDYYVIEEGMGGRTTVHDDPFEPDRCGRTYLPVALRSHAPLDLVILSLGTNDCKSHFHLNPALVARGADILCEMIETYPYHCGGTPKILLVSPIEMGDDLSRCPFESFDQESVACTKALAPYFERAARRHGCLFLDASKVAKAGRDQLHMEAEGHAALAEALCGMIQKEFA